MSQGNKIIFIIVGGCVFIVGIVLYFVFEDKIWPSPTVVQTVTPAGNTGSLPAPDYNKTPVGGQDVVEAPKAESPKPLTTEEKAEQNLLRLVKSFAERYGSYSNSSNFENLRDLMPFMTTEMKNWTEKYISEQKSDQVSNNYYGIMTVVVSQKISQNGGYNSTVVCNTQRTENQNNKSRVFYQDLKIDFIKSGNGWLINGVYWQ